MRTTAEKVLSIMDDVDLDTAQVEEYIESANIMVTQIMVNTGVPAPTLTEIERWLTAHMIIITKNRQAKKEEAGGAKIEYAGEFGQGLQSSSYGQMVLSLDYTGSFASLAGKKAYMRAIKS